ncbi:hypothetical protein [Aquipseudomonas alcaligenes]|uniref:Uncharacterized protein n=1 Tax=Aquipseudomonas alcaligenes TaxID=43263 RepID=A0AA37CJU8_AQUAC|nr:hypothetical protein [Pseudomonas alcaligenes]BCR26230.1 hypothetical protein KAM426_37570 [Pseudomonas alcaligenes]GIZ68774.1 hypothetical protein KAM428_38590 [Pseudomonas alcaligenes]GIZ73158.1 hypothetical protein KAM429_39190 [Pseudomonas alcaligenes]GIZ77525.1 hypothetical protein KAM430_39340 [Pseudomonas alcaligenes]GIZ81834.1 hypothetical protein KAM432_38820 [Pseudomonas alcaligenes]
MTTDYMPLFSKGLATLPGVQAVDVIGGIFVVILINDSSIAVTRADLAEELGLEKRSAMVGYEHVLSLSTVHMLDLIKRTASAASTK